MFSHEPLIDLWLLIIQEKHMTARLRQLVKKCGHFKVGSKTGGGDKNKDESRVENIRT